MGTTFRIGTRESQLAVWQATQVQNMLAKNAIDAELVFIKSEGDIDLKTPLYEIGVQGIFTRSLDIALLNNEIDVAVHSMKDVPTQLPAGIAQAAVLKRGSHKDLLVYKGEWPSISEQAMLVATSSIRRKAQWLHRFPHHHITNLRGNVNTRLKKLTDSDWNAAIFAAAGLERIGLRPPNSVELDWMLPAPAQGAIIIVCRDDDPNAKAACLPLHDEATGFCTKQERDFLRSLLGGCSTPISALATIDNDVLNFKGNILSPGGEQIYEVELSRNIGSAASIGNDAATEILNKGALQLTESLRDAGK